MQLMNKDYPISYIGSNLNFYLIKNETNGKIELSLKCEGVNSIDQEPITIDHIVCEMGKEQFNQFINDLKQVQKQLYDQPD